VKKKIKVTYPPFINWWIPKLLIKQFFCRHNFTVKHWAISNFTYCSKCNKIKEKYYDDEMDRLVREEFKDGY
jgi:hypothetical protein